VKVFPRRASWRPPACPICTLEARTTETRFGKRHECCGLWSWNGAPLETYATHEARKIAHAAFDKLWQEGGLDRTRAYRLLAEDLGLPGDEAHMARMDAETAMKVPFAVVRIWAQAIREGREGKKTPVELFEWPLE
jgi:hypothetical protein